MKKLTSILVLSVIYFSCSRGLDSVECDSKNTDEGIIVSSVDFGSCIYNLENKTFIVQDSIGYINLQLEIKNATIGDDSCSFPSIVFNDTTNTLLGQYAQATGCTINFNRNVEVDSTTKQANYIINPEGCGDCEMLGYSYNFVLVEKIDSTYSILFNGEVK